MFRKIACISLNTVFGRVLDSGDQALGLAGLDSALEDQDLDWGLDF
jgi:hypothetical protein